MELTKLRAWEDELFEALEKVDRDGFNAVAYRGDARYSQAMWSRLSEAEGRKPQYAIVGKTIHGIAELYLEYLCVVAKRHEVQFSGPAMPWLEEAIARAESTCDYMRAWVAEHGQQVSE